MNCRSNQLCRVIDPGDFYGMIIRTTVLDTGCPELAWCYEGPLLDHPKMPCFAQYSFFDRMLRPLADPADDEIDESLHWTDAPEGVDLIDYQEPQLT